MIIDMEYKVCRELKLDASKMNREQRSKKNGRRSVECEKIKALRALRCFRHPLFVCSFVGSSFVGFAVLGIWRVLGLARGERFL